MKRVFVVVAVVGALVGLFLFGLLRGQPDRDITSNILNKPVADFELPLYERYQGTYGPTVKLSEFSNKPRVVNFWASWCGPCEYEAPVLEAAARAYGDEVQFIGVQTQDKGQREAGQAFINKFNLSFPNVIDDNSATGIEYGVFGVPETFFIRADGTLAYKHAGPVTADLVETQIATLLQ